MKRALTPATLCWLAAATFLWLPFTLQYTGEEAAYTLQAYELWHGGHLLQPTLLGSPYGRPPLYPLLIGALAQPFGWSNLLAAARLLSAAATLLGGLALYGFCRRMGQDRERSTFTLMTYLGCGEVLFWYGWLGYSDALFGALTLGALLAGWLALHERRARWLAAALVLAAAGFLTKALTSYVFLGCLLLPAAWHYRAWQAPRVVWMRWVACLPLLALPWGWYHLIPAGDAMAHGMVGDVTQKLGWQGVLPYLRHLVTYPLEAFSGILPPGLLATLALFRARARPSAPDGQVLPWRVAVAALVLGALPYWLAPQSSARYLMPLYGLAALGLSATLWPDPVQRRRTAQWMLVTVLVKGLAATWLLPLHTRMVRPDLAAIAHRVLVQQDGALPALPLYADDTTWAAESVAALIDATPLADGGDRPPLVHPPASLQDGWILAGGTPDPALGQMVQRYDGVTLLCRGRACR